MTESVHSRATDPLAPASRLSSLQDRDDRTFLAIRNQLTYVGYFGSELCRFQDLGIRSPADQPSADLAEIADTHFENKTPIIVLGDLL